MTSYSADTWPIAAKMNFGPLTEERTLTVDAGERVWQDQMLQVAEFGFDAMDPMDDWIPLADLDDQKFALFQKVAKDNGLSVPAVSIGRQSVVDVERGAENVKIIHRTIDRAAELGAKIINIGFQQALTQAQKEALWFWLAAGHVDDPKLRDLAIERVREVADHAQQAGMEVSLEMYEDTYVGTPDDAVAFCKDVDHPAVGLNPDIGNLIRLHRPMEKYDVMHEKVFPYANYWHAKNYIRDEDSATGSYMSAPVPLEIGTMNYRQLIRRAIQLGFNGPFMVEHYGSDWLAVGAANRDYIRQVLRGALRTFRDQK